MKLMITTIITFLFSAIVHAGMDEVYAGARYLVIKSDPNSTMINNFAIQTEYRPHYRRNPPPLVLSKIDYITSNIEPTIKLEGGYGIFTIKNLHSNASCVVRYNSHVSGMFNQTVHHHVATTVYNNPQNLYYCTLTKTGSDNTYQLHFTSANVGMTAFDKSRNVNYSEFRTGNGELIAK